LKFCRADFVFVNAQMLVRNLTRGFCRACKIPPHEDHALKSKNIRQGQILKLVVSGAISSQDELRKRLSHVKVRVTQATLSRDMSELKLVKTTAGYSRSRTARKPPRRLPPLVPRPA